MYRQILYIVFCYVPGLWPCLAMESLLHRHLTLYETHGSSACICLICALSSVAEVLYLEGVDEHASLDLSVLQTNGHLFCDDQGSFLYTPLSFPYHLACSYGIPTF
jgi:hypothetical protein